MTAAMLLDTDLLAVADDVVRGLASAAVNPAGCFVRTPVLYPGGSSVVVRVDRDEHHFSVSDYGHGYAEAEMMCAAETFDRIAGTIAEGAGVEIRERGFLASNLVRDELIGAVMAVAYCSQRAVVETALRIEDQASVKDRNAFAYRLVRLFGNDRVEQNAKVPGADYDGWVVLARIRGGSGPVLFDHVEPVQAAVMTATAKFHDIARRDDPPRRIVSVNGKAEMRRYIGLLSQAAEVIETGVDDDVLRRLAL